MGLAYRVLFCACYIIVSLHLGATNAENLEEVSRPPTSANVTATVNTVDRSKNPGKIAGVFIQTEAKLLGEKWRKFSDDESAVYTLQKIFDGLPYSDVDFDLSIKLDEVCHEVQRKLTRYLRQLRYIKQRVEQLYQQHRKSRGSDSVQCCHLPREQLQWDENYQQLVSDKLTCDHLPPTHSAESSFNPGRNLTQLFKTGVSIGVKWQYFMSATGLHNEYPAHRTLQQVPAEDCDSHTDHQRSAIYISTIYKHRKNVVIMVDHGNSLSLGQLTTAKMVARHILLSLGSNDRVSVIGLSSVATHARDTGCLSTQLVPRTFEVQLYFASFIDKLQKTQTTTNHSLGFEEAFQIINYTFADSNEEAMIVYISRGLLSSIVDARVVMETIANGNGRLAHKVVINTYAIIDKSKLVVYEKSFLRDIALQNIHKHPISVTHTAPLPKGKMVAINSTRGLASAIGNFLEPFNWTISSTATVSEPFTDSTGHTKGLMLALTWPCFYNNKLLGVVGMDMHLASLLEELTYFSADKSSSYAFLIDGQGFVLAHPSLERPELSRVQSVRVSVLRLEMHAGFSDTLHKILQESSGTSVLRLSVNATTTRVKYMWKWLTVRQLTASTRFIVCVKHDNRQLRRLKAITEPSSSQLLYHRLDLLPTEDTCKNLHQISSQGSSTLFLASSSFHHPFAHLSEVETKRMVQGYLAYLHDGTALISNPGIKEYVRRDVAALSKINEFWSHQIHTGENNDYIVRRYVATPSGVLLMTPGTLLNKSFDPTMQSWYLRASEFVGRVTFTAPYLDPGGSGYIITISHTVYSGKSDALHSPFDTVTAVSAVDVTLGYVYRQLIGQLNICTHGNVRCFIMDDRGYLIAHRALLEPNGIGPLKPQHITHQEPLVANDILYHQGFVEKKKCNSYDNRTTQRFYHFNTSLHGILTNIAHGEPCAKYQIAVIPGTNTFLGIINETCSMMQAFCPCSIVDRMCLNCDRMEQSECECPCECPLAIDFCTGQLSSDQFNVSSCENGAQHPVAMATSISNSLPQCDRLKCSAKKDKWSCMGVVGCEWCALDHDAVTQLHPAFCGTQLACFSGVLGAKSPYDSTITGNSDTLDAAYIRPAGTATGSTQVGPVAGGLMAGFIALALAVYCYRHRAAQRAGYESAATQADGQRETLDDIDDNDSGHTNIVLSPFDVTDMASVSPYRVVVNPSYQRRPAASDHGYSSMSPPSHDDSASTTTCTEPVRQRPSAVNHPTVATPTAIPPPPPPPVVSPPSEQTVLDDGLLSGNRILASVQVHMVDTH